MYTCGNFSVQGPPYPYPQGAQPSNSPFQQQPRQEHRTLPALAPYAGGTMQ